MAKYSYSDGTTPTICIIGAGFSGILAGVKLKTKLSISDFVILDQNEDVGGVWLVNTYPGCGSDVPSHFYSYSFELNPYWSRNYASQPEILEYLQNVVKKYNLSDNIKFQARVDEVLWVENLCQWRVRVFDKKTQKALEYFFDIVINSPGALRVPNIPEKFKTFKGIMFHSAQWDPSVDLSDKVVAVIGSGASAVQIIPKLASKVKVLHCYQRKPAWLMPKVDFKFPRGIQWIFAHVPLILLLFRWLLFWALELFYPALMHGTVTRQIVKFFAVRNFKNQIPDNKELRKKLLPDYAFGCARIMVSNEYLPAMCNPNVKLHVDPIVAINTDSIESKLHGLQKIDVLILATGFKVQEYFAPMSIIGKNGQNLLELWIKERPRGYLGLVTTCSPNQFGIIGPHAGLAHNSVIFMAECQMNYIVKLLVEMMRLNARVVELKKSTEEKEMMRLDMQMKRMVWGNGACGSWYENASGLNTTLWPWSCVNYWKRTRKPIFKKFNFLTVLDSVIIMRNNNSNNYNYENDSQLQITRL